MAEQPTTQPKNNTRNQLLLISVAIVLLAGGFYSGTLYQKAQGSKSNNKSLSNASNGGFAGRGLGGGSQRRGGFGQVTAVSSTSITVENSRTMTSKTYTVAGDTSVLNQGQTGSIGDIKTGDQVVIQPSTSDPNHAATIRLGNFGAAVPPQQINSN